MGENGVGKAHVTYFPAFYGEVDLTYEVVNSNGKTYIALYNSLEAFGLLSYNAADKTLDGSFYSAMTEEIFDNVRFCLYDNFYGKWTSEELGMVEFNGFGNYKTGASENYVSTDGTLKIGDKSVDYTLDNGTLKGSFVYDGKTYVIEYDEENGNIKVTSDDTSFTLTRVQE